MDGLPEAPEPLPLPVIDSHCHLDMRAGIEGLDIDEAVALAAEVGVDRFVQVGCDVEGARWSVLAAQRLAPVVATVALHPNEAPRLAAKGGREAFELAMSEIEVLAADEAVVAVGETGLDFFRTGDEGRDIQEESFRRHIQLARRLGKPVVVHDREAHADVIRVLDDEPSPPAVVLHCFSGDTDFAREAVVRGWFCSFAGTVTFKNAQPLRDALRLVPDELVLVETDAPYLTPSPHRGRPNSPYLIPHTVRTMAQVRDQSVEKLCMLLRDNTFQVFGQW
ncbi:MAG: TatD family hydrolase [Actinobacteria bacterium]|nr:TatD family hydrolase [Actinomycetota bacterium]